MYSRVDNIAGNLPEFGLSHDALLKTEGYYQFYHEKTGYAFFVYATAGDVSALTSIPAGVTKVSEWTGSRKDLFDIEIDKIVTKELLTMPSEVKKLRAILEMKLWYPF